MFSIHDYFHFCKEIFLVPFIHTPQSCLFLWVNDNIAAEETF